MTNPNQKSRQEIQTEALAIESILNAAMATSGCGDPQETFRLIESAHDRARDLHLELDNVNAPDEAPASAPSRDFKAERDQLEQTVSDMMNLTAALQVICWQLAQTSMGGDTGLMELRDSVIGLGDAMEQRLKRGMAA